MSAESHCDEVFKRILDDVRVLVVDPSEENLSAFEQILTLHGATVELAESPAAATRALDQAPPHVVIADEEFDVVGFVHDRQPADDRPTPVIALTAHGSQEGNEALVQAGCHAVLCKPFDPEKLITLIAASVGRC